MPLRDYVAQVRRQSTGGSGFTADVVKQALSQLVLSDSTRNRVGRAIFSGRPTLIYGPSGNGKTTIAHLLGQALSGYIAIPYALEVYGHIVRLFDPSKHERFDYEEQAGDLRRRRHDRRWAIVRRPAVMAGGELTRQGLELVLDERSKVYEAPIQMKANGGILVIDDFGRQQIPAVELLNRWIVALEGGVDHLSLHTGQIIEVPFDVIPFFSTNLPPEALADEAFLRRIRYKVEIPDPTPERVPDHLRASLPRAADRAQGRGDRLPDRALVRAISARASRLPPARPHRSDRRCGALRRQRTARPCTPSASWTKSATRTSSPVSQLAAGRSRLRALASLSARAGLIQASS